MLLLQTKKSIIIATNAFLIIFLLSCHIQVHAEITDKREMAQAQWEQGRDIFYILSTTYFTISYQEQMSSRVKDYQSALEKFNNSLSLYRELGDLQSVADLLTWIAKVYLETGKYVDAMNYLKKSHEIYEKLNVSPGEKSSVRELEKAMKAMLLFVVGKSHQDEEDYKSALKKYKTALQLVKKIGEKRYEGGLLWEIGMIQYELENYSDAERYYQEALNIFKKLGKKDFEGRILFNMARVYYVKDKNTKSLEYFDKALKIFEQFNDKNGMKAALAWKGYVYNKQNDYSNALPFYKKALAISQDIEGQRNDAEITEMLGLAYRGMGYLNIPTKYYEQALNIIQKTGNHPKEGDILYTIGQLYSDMGDYEEALKIYNKAMKIYKENNLKIYHGEVLVEIGKVKSKLGNYLEAIDNLKEALKILEGIKDSDASKRLALSYLENVYRLLGADEKVKKNDLKRKGIEQPDMKTKWGQWNYLQKQGWSFVKENKYDKALDVFHQALDLSKEINNKGFKRTSLTSIGFTYKFLREYSKALDFYKQALEVSRKHNDKGGELIVLLDIAETYNYPFLSDYPNTLDYYEQALIIAKEIGDKPSEEKCLTSMGLIYMEQEKDEKAVEYLEEALKVSKGMSVREEIWKAQNNLGQLAYFSGDLQKAKSYYSEAINTIESIRGKISVEEYKTSFIEDKIPIYADMIDVLLGLKEDEEAFNYVERAKSRSLLDLLGNRLKLKKEKDKELSHEEIKLQKKINELLDKIRKEHSQLKGEQRAELGLWNKELKETRKQYARHLLRLKKDNSELYSLVNVDPLTLREVQELIEPDTTLLEYFIHPNGIIVWIVDNSKHKSVITLIPNTELNSKITTFREKIASLQPDYEKKAEELYDLLIRPAKPYIKTKRICIVSHSVLHYLPFQALLNVPVFSRLGITVELKDGVPTVAFIFEETPAFKADIHVGDKIMAIDGDPTINMSLNSVVSKLRGEPLTTILLEVVSGKSETSKTIKLIRENVMKSSIYSQFYGSNANDKNNEVVSKTSFLIEEYDIFYAPSASVLKFVLKKRKEVLDKVLAFGNPELGDEDLSLLHAEEEVRKIKESYPKTALYLKEKATEEKAKLLSGYYDIIHFASHGELNPESPLFSCIKLAKEKDEDGRLEVHEIFNLNLENTSLVTLSACETGLGKLSKGDELIGLTRGFIYAGTPSIVASLWMVNDQSTSELMNLFYKNLKTHSKAESLRLAQLEMINGEVGRGIVRGVGGITISKEDKEKPQTSMTVNGSHPYFWAPFILLGDWK
ncbi:MAG: tetratricopeptide repeat protein [Candidatus Scalinduaceae bacterium]